jgi:DNA polymerase I-like protein with 3'-5' exonuclease and polymerase domains/uracil-DNA glycosylase
MNDDTSTAPESIETPPEETAEEAAAREAAEAAAAIAATKPPEHCPLCPRYTTGHRCRASVPRSGAASDILWVYAQPELLDAGAANPGSAGPTASVMKVALNALWQQHPEWQRLSIRRTYAVQCTPLKEGEKPRKATLDACAPHLADVIVETAPKLVVAFGSEVLKQLGVEAKFSDVRGRVLEPAVTGFPVPILVTFSDRQIAAAPGVFETFKQDLRNGYMRIVRGTSTDTAFEELTKEYVSPATMDEALALLDEILATPETTTLSVDTETTSLRPEKDGTKIIAFCFSWGVGKAATLLFDHPHAPPEYLERLGELEAQIRRLLASPRPKVLHNAKFDLKWIELKYRMPVANVVWCTLCGEHLLDEDKKGNYGLKALTAVWIPKFCGYEDKLYDILEDAEKNPYAEVDAKLETLTEEYDGYAEELIAYKAAMTDYETKQQEWQRIKDEYDAARAEYEQKNEAYKAALAAWEARPKRGLKPSKPKAPKKDEATPEALAAHLEHLRTYDAALAAWEAWETPPKPVKDFLAPPRPLALERPPKMPKDPRTKKEIHYATDAGFEKVPLHELQLYGGVDADVTRRLSSIQLNRLNEEAKQSGLVSSHTRRLMATHAVPASRVLGEMEYYGTRIDQAYIGVLQKGLTKVIEDSLAELAKMAPGVNINSAPELAKLLYDQGWKHPDGTVMPTVKCLELTKGGARSVAEKALKPYLKYDTVTENGKKKEIPKKESYFLHHLFLYKKALKARDTFLVNIRVLSRRDGVIHTSFHLNGTGTGRLSSSDMNLQNVPKKLAGYNLKKLFIADSSDYVIVNADYKGAEVRVFTAYARDPALIKALNEGLDMHSFFAAKVFGHPYEDFENRDNEASGLSKEYRDLLGKLRTQIKRVVFGILYGAGEGKIAETIGVTKEDGKALIELLFTMFPAIKDYIEEVKMLVMRDGYVETLFGRRRRFPLTATSRHRSRAERQACNFKIQSTSSDIVIGQLIEIRNVIFSEQTWPEWGIHKPLHTYGVRLLLTVHDSIVLQWPKKLLPALEPWLTHYGETRVRDKYPWLPVPFKMDIEVGDSYGECVPIPKYIQGLPPDFFEEGVIEEQELLTELREDAFEGA